MDAPVLLRWVLGMALFASPVVASAQPTAGLVFPGNTRAAIEKQVGEALLDSFLVAPSATQSQMKSYWKKPAVGRLSARNLNMIQPVLEVADASGVAVVIAADVEMRGKRRRARPFRVALVAIRVADGSIVGKEKLKIRMRGRGRKRKLTIDSRALGTFFKRTAKIIEQSAPAKTDSDTVADANAGKDLTPTFEDTSPKASVKTVIPRIKRARWTRAGRTLNVEAYGLVHGRSFQYFDTLTRNLREFDSGLSFGAGARGEIYPLILKRKSGTTRRIGLVGGYAQDFGIQPSVADAPDVTLEHAWREWFAGAAVAWDFKNILIRAQATYGEYSATFTATEEFAAAAELPSVSYQNLGLGLFGRYEMSNLSLPTRPALRMKKY
ncbi:MAG: hypothetical protein AAFQ82_21935 [Myxococcota bacterium]